MPQVLIAYEADLVRALCAIILERQGFDVLQATNGREAVELYESFHPDASLLNIAMPELDGIAARAEIKRIDPDSQVGLLLAVDEYAEVARIQHAGIRDYMTKPFDGAMLIGAVHRLLHQRQTRRRQRDEPRGRTAGGLIVA